LRAIGEALARLSQSGRGAREIAAAKLHLAQSEGVGFQLRIALHRGAELPLSIIRPIRRRVRLAEQVMHLGRVAAPECRLGPQDGLLGVAGA
jgi:hypothetical protein